MDFLRETTFWPLGGAAPQIFTRARDCQRLPYAHPKVGWGPPPSQKKLIVKT